MSRKDEQNIKMIFEEHLSRLASWPPTWVDIEDVIREAYWSGVSTATGSTDDTSRENTLLDWERL